MTPMPESFLYDRVPYSNQPYHKTRPHHLATIAALYGMRPALPSRCRTLELGCGGGGNIIPMAYSCPDSEFVGIDLSKQAVLLGQTAVEQLGLSNVSLEHRDLMDLSEKDGGFDYIIAHGVYSWVPQAVRDKLLSVFKTNLNPHGIAYVSYNALPGAYMHVVARSIMHYHVRNIDDPAARSVQSRSLIKMLADVSADNQVYGLILRDQAHRIEALSEEVFIHDDLNQESVPFFLYQVIEAAAQHGLQYIADADYPILGLHGRSDKIRALLSSIPEQEAAVREQYIDFIDGRMFRMSLFCHENVTLNRPATPDRIKTLHLSSALAPDDAGIDAATEDAVVFRTSFGETLRTNQPLGKAALLVMAEVCPEAIAFDELVSRAMARLGPKAPEPTTSELEALANLLFQAVRTNIVDADYEPPRLTRSVSRRPKASGVARWQLAAGSGLVTNLLHGAVMFEDETLRRFVPLVDGTRTMQELRDDLERSLTVNSPPLDQNISELTKMDAVQGALDLLGRRALLES